MAKSMQYETKGIVEKCGFPVKLDIYGGLTLDTKHTRIPQEQFLEKITESIAQWRQEGVRAVWVKIRKEHSWAVPFCSQTGFDFHHAQPGYVMMNQWLSDKETNQLPGYANQYLGVAGLVINSKNQLLVIQERFNVDNTPRWKLPGGLADSGEELGSAAKREVFEETGVETEFVSVLSFRHQHKFRFDCSDFYFICLMRPLSEDIDHCPQEIAQCRWLDIDEYANDPNVTDANKHWIECYQEQLKHSTPATIKPTPVLSFNKKYYNSVYSIDQPTQESEVNFTD